MPGTDARIHSAQAMRQADAPLLAQALMQGREQLLAMHSQLYAQLGDKPLPQLGTLNPLLWELGHVAWFEEWWIARNSQRNKGVNAEPDAARTASCLKNADALYDSSNVPHHTRWSLPLPSYAATLEYAKIVRERTLSLLDEADNDDEALYFYRLALFHEDMHREALIYMAQSQSLSLNILPTDTCDKALNMLANIYIHNTVYTLNHAQAGFVFDNELQSHDIKLDAFEIDAQAVTWQQYLPFIESDGYSKREHWSAAGWQWLQSQHASMPRYLRLDVRHDYLHWQRCEFGQWQALDMSAAACNLSYYEAEAWCHWAGRRLPSEAEWECAITTHGEMQWGEVWEWTSSEFAPYPGFTPHPYRDYSAPWFSGRQVLRGGSRITAPRMKHARYRNFFTPERNDVFAGFRSCKIV